MRQRTFAVDWDGTCVTDSWPAMGEWNHGAIEALHAMTELGHVVIHTCRIAPMEVYNQSIPRDPALVQQEINGIRAMLDAQGLHTVEVWTKPYKPPAVEYIDNRARRYAGRRNSWRVITQQMNLLYGKRNPADLLLEDDE